MSVLMKSGSAGAGGGGLSISNSLRFRASASAYLSRTFGTPTDAKAQTWKFSVKRGGLSSTMDLLWVGTSGTSYALIRFASDNTLLIQSENGGLQYSCQTNAVLRDPSGHYDIEVKLDTANATAASRLVVSINGVSATFSGSPSYPSLNYSGLLGSAIAHTIGRRNDSPSNYFDGYLSDVYFIDGQALTPSYFGESNTDGVWVPKSYSGTYGTNGFHLDFKDAALTVASNVGLGKDVSGNGNYWTTNNISVTAGVTYDSMVDTPTNNYATLNPLDLNGTVGSGIAYANMQVTQTALAALGIRGTQVFGSPTYVEAKYTNAAGTGYTYLGICAASEARGSLNPTGLAGVTANQYIWRDDANKGNNGASSAYGSSLATGDTACFFYDPANSSIWFGKVTAGIATWFGSGDPQNNTNATYTSVANATAQMPFFGFMGQNANPQWDINLGQRPFLATSGIPTRAKALCTANLPAVAITNPRNHFDVNTRSGTGASATKTGLGFQPDLVWVKARSAATDHKLTDAVRGVTKALISDTTGAETTDANGVTAFTSDGYTVGSDTNYNNSTGPVTYVDWLWKANGAGVSNTAGTITSTVSANTTAGFSIVSYTGTGVSSSQTVGHGLGVVPAMLIVRPRNAVLNWFVWHRGLTGSNNCIEGLNTTSAQSSQTVWQSPAAAYTPTSSVFHVWNGAVLNAANNYVAYCFAEIPGYSKFGSYTGNGSTDGPFVFCGFRPRYVMWKHSSTTGQWVLADSARDTYNLANHELYANLSNAEDTGGNFYADFTANGFKVRSSTGDINLSGQTIIFAAFAEYPFGGSNCSPSPAR